MNSGASDPVLIGLDWGTSSLRAFLIDAEGRVREQLASSDGIMQVPGRDFDAVFRVLVGPWLERRPLPVLMSGMITSRNGWVETPYVGLPLTAAELARSLASHTTKDGFKVHFVTGVMTQGPSGPDVMRGEETQIIGALAQGSRDGLFVMPGTHSKWVTVRTGQIEDYATYMTGEVFAALKEHTILGTLVEPGPFDAKGFDLGVKVGLQTGCHLLHDLFKVRTLPLMEQMPKTSVAEYLSGLLIGAEVAAATEGRDPAQTAITIVGGNDLTNRYERALKQAGLSSTRAPEDIVVKGHLMIAQSAGLVRP